jgi:hypothetical protein
MWKRKVCLALAGSVMKRSIRVEFPPLKALPILDRALAASSISKHENNSDCGCDDYHD